MHGCNCHNEECETHIRPCSLIPISVSCHTARAECFILCASDLLYDLNLTKCNMH